MTVTANDRHAITYIVDEPFNQVQKKENSTACFVTIGFRVHHATAEKKQRNKRHLRAIV